MDFRHLTGILIPVLIFLAGCSPVNQTVRYGDKNQPTKNEENVRYQETTTPDTLTSLNDDEDPEFKLLNRDNNYKIADAFSSLPQNTTVYNSSLPPNLEEEFKMAIIMYQDTPYKFGGNNDDGIDCSAFTQNVFRQAGNISLHRTARDQYTQGEVIPARENLVFGDLVFFDTRRRVKPGHVGIYITNGLFAHASSKYGVIISSLEQDYYNRKYMGARRVLNGI